MLRLLIYADKVVTATATASGGAKAGGVSSRMWEEKVMMAVVEENVVCLNSLLRWCFLLSFSLYNGFDFKSIRYLWWRWSLGTDVLTAHPTDHLLH